MNEMWFPFQFRRNADQYAPSDLLQNWRNGIEYIFLEATDDVVRLATFMKANEMDGAKSVHFAFPNDTSDGHQTSNHIAVNVSGFSDGFDAFQMACASPQQVSMTSVGICDTVFSYVESES